MPTTLLEPIPISTEAASLAGENLRKNLAALAKTQPTIEQTANCVPAGLEWTFGRDGSLTGRIDGKWWHHCSIPNSAARMILQSFAGNGAVFCFLAPLHAAQLKAALAMLRREQAIIALIPCPDTFAVMLGCEDLSAEIESHRLWFATGDQWPDELRNIFEFRAGLPLPTSFIRCVLTQDDLAQKMIAAAQTVFAREIDRRAKAIGAIRDRSTPPNSIVRRVCVIAGSQFRLWDNAAETLLRSAQSGTWDIARLDPDDPISTGPLALAEAAGQCDAVLSANLGRSDVPEAVDPQRPWLTWITSSRVPAYSEIGQRDVLLLADALWREAAHLAGWPEAQIKIATWPRSTSRLTGPVSKLHPLTLITDTIPQANIGDTFDLSSHKLLAELVERELRNDPFVLDSNIAGYIQQRMERLGISPDGFDRGAFIQRIVLPCYQQGIGRLLIGDGLPVSLFGAGWTEISEFKPHAAGMIQTHDRFDEAIDAAGALVHVWPWPDVHPIDSLGRPVLRRSGRRKESFLRQARQPELPAATAPELSAQSIAEALLEPSARP